MKQIEKEILEQLTAEPKVYRLVSVYNKGDEDWKDFSDLDEALEAMAIADRYITDIERKQGNRVYVGMVDGDDYAEVWTMADKFRRDVTKQVGQNIKEARADAGMTQKQLAEKLGTAQQQITRYETGEQDLTLTRLREIEIVLNLTAGDLLKYP